MAFKKGDDIRKVRISRKHENDVFHDCYGMIVMKGDRDHEENYIDVENSELSEA
jgi:hypothetical protein